MADWNTYAEWDEARCLARISVLQDQISLATASLTGPAGGAAYVAAEKAKLEVWELRCQVASLRGLPRPPPPPRNDPNRRVMRYHPVVYDGGY